MIVDKSEIEALKQQNTEPERAAAPTVPSASPDTPLVQPGKLTGEIQRLLRLRVPLIVRLAHRNMKIGEIRRLSLGAIIEFSRAVNEPLDLLINNQLIARGVAVRVGDRFGLRIQAIRNRADRIQAMGERHTS